MIITEPAEASATPAAKAERPSAERPSSSPYSRTLATTAQTISVVMYSPLVRLSPLSRRTELRSASWMPAKTIVESKTQRSSAFPPPSNPFPAIPPAETNRRRVSVTPPTAPAPTAAAASPLFLPRLRLYSCRRQTEMRPPESTVAKGKWSGGAKERGDDATTSASPATMTAEAAIVLLETPSPRRAERSTVQGTTVPPRAAAVDSPMNLIEIACIVDPTNITSELPTSGLPVAIALVPRALDSVPQRTIATPSENRREAAAPPPPPPSVAAETEAPPPLIKVVVPMKAEDILAKTPPAPDYFCLIAVTVPFSEVRGELQRRGVLRTFANPQRTTTLLSVADKLARGDHLKEWRTAVVLEANAGTSARVYEALTHGCVFVLSAEVAHMRYPRRKHISVAALNVSAADAHTPYFVVSCNGRSRAVTFSNICEEIVRLAEDDEQAINLY